MARPEKKPGALNGPEGNEYPPKDMTSETTLLMGAVKSGQKGAFESLTMLVRGRAYRVARSLVGSQEDALDMTQETFLKVFRARATFRDGEPFLPWFHRILRNTCISHLRRHNRVRVLSLSGTDQDGEAIDWQLEDPAPGPEERALRDERIASFREAFAQLSARDREILTLREFEDLTYRQIAQTLEIPEGTVMSRLYHARRRLRDQLEPILHAGAVPHPAGYQRPIDG
jgi:RNA polymerase sigma-70 factor (ECF subfamily)